MSTNLGTNTDNVDVIQVLIIIIAPLNSQEIQPMAM